MEEARIKTVKDVISENTEIVAVQHCKTKTVYTTFGKVLLGYDAKTFDYFRQEETNVGSVLRLIIKSEEV